jgi:hypothetical protein
MVRHMLTNAKYDLGLVLAESWNVVTYFTKMPPSNSNSQVSLLHM